MRHRFKKGKVELHKGYWKRRVDHKNYDSKLKQAREAKESYYWVRYKNVNGRIGWTTEILKNRFYAFHLGLDWAITIGCQFFDENGKQIR